MSINNITHALTVAALLGTASFTPAQNAFDPNIGIGQAAGDDTLTTPLNLGFSFRFPDGTMTTTVEADSNGRVLLPGTDPADYSQTFQELLVDPASICPLWVDLWHPPGDVFFNATPNVALITWIDSEEWWITGSQFSFQCQLYPDGRIVFAYDSRIPSSIYNQPNPIVGISSGNGYPNPGNSDFSTAPFMSNGVPTIYEDFMTTGQFDLADSWLEFAPDGIGGYNVSRGTPGGFPTPASARKFGPSGAISIEITPDGAGGYIVTPCGNGWEQNLGVGLNVTMDDEMLPAQNLGFTFTWPGGAAVTAVEIDSNGRILPGGSGDTSDFSPSVTELLNDPWGTIAPFWSDYDPTISRPGADIFLNTGTDGMGRNFATITYSGLAQWFLDGTEIDFQCVLRSDGSMKFSYLGTNVWNALEDDVLIGFSPGNAAADPGESDISSVGTVGTPSALQLGSTLYEYFDPSIPEFVDLQLTLEGLTAPVINGANFEMRIDAIPPGSISAAILMGLTSPGVPLDLIGMANNSLLSDGSLATIPMTIMGSSSNLLSLPATTDTSLEGVTLFFQAGVLAPGQDITALGAVLSNGLEAVIGF